MYSNVNLKVLWIKNLANLLGFGASFVKKINCGGYGSTKKDLLISLILVQAAEN